MVHELTRQTAIEKFVIDYKSKIASVDMLLESNATRRYQRLDDVDLLIEKHRLNAQRQAYVQAMKELELLLDL